MSKWMAHFDTLSEHVHIVDTFPRRIQGHEGQTNYCSQNKKQSQETVSQNRELSRKYGIEGYPSVLLIDADGTVIAKTGYQQGGAKAYVEHLKSLLARQKK